MLTCDQNSLGFNIFIELKIGYWENLQNLLESTREKLEGSIDW
jgi:hypothetical protein